MIPKDHGKQFDAPRVVLDVLLLPDGTLNVAAVVSARQFHVEMAEYLGSLLPGALTETKPIAINRRPNDWRFLLDGATHIIDPAVWDEPDIVKMRNKIHAGVQYLRKQTGVNYRASVNLQENPDGTWYLEAQVSIREDAD